MRLRLTFEGERGAPYLLSVGFRSARPLEISFTAVRARMGFRLPGVGSGLQGACSNAGLRGACGNAGHRGACGNAGLVPVWKTGLRWDLPGRSLDFSKVILAKGASSDVTRLGNCLQIAGLVRVSAVTLPTPSARTKSWTLLSWFATV